MALASASTVCGILSSSVPLLRRAVNIALLTAALPIPPAVSEDQYDEIAARTTATNLLQRTSFGIPQSLGRADILRFPSWLEGEWEVTSRPIATAAPLGVRFLPPDLMKMPIGSLSDRPQPPPPLRYKVRFMRRDSDGAVVADRTANLRAVQDAAAGYSRVEQCQFDGSTLKISYSGFGRNGSFYGPSRAEIYITNTRQSSPRQPRTFAFDETTRTVSITSTPRATTVADAETVNCFERLSDGRVSARQRVARFLTPNPNSAEGVLWQEAGGRAVALLDYELLLTSTAVGGGNTDGREH